MYKRYKPHILLAYEALFRMLLPKYRSNETIRAEYFIHRTGYLGERNVDYKLSLFPRTNFFHLPGVRLRNNTNPFQIDSLLLTPKVIFLIETKNIKGILEYYHSKRQIIQRDGEKITAYKDPLLQAMVQKKHLQLWLRDCNIDIPIEYLIVSANQQTIIHNNDASDDFDWHFTTLENLPFRLDDMYNTYSKNVLSPKQIKKLSSYIYKNSSPLIVDLLEKWRINPGHLTKGTTCVHCGISPLIRAKRSWKCSRCNKDARPSYTRLIHDFFLLYNQNMTNSRCKHLLQLETDHEAYRILKMMGLETEGANKNRVYLPPSLWEYSQDAEPDYLKRSIFASG